MSGLNEVEEPSSSAYLFTSYDSEQAQERSDVESLNNEVCYVTSYIIKTYNSKTIWNSAQFAILGKSIARSCSP